LVSGWVSRYDSFGDPQSLTWNMHQAFEIEVVLSGHHERDYEGLTLTTGPGDVSLVPAWEPHGSRDASLDAILLVIFFLPEFLGDEMLGDVSWLSLFVAAPLDRPQVTSDEVRRRVLAIAAELRREVEVEGEQAPGWLTAMRLGVLQLLFTVSRRWKAPTTGRTRPGARPGDLTRIAPAMTLAGSRPGHRISLENGAEACSLSSSRFGSIFRHAMGMSFGQFALRSRLAYAARLILATDGPLEAIARESGFTDASHFHHAFRKRYGCTPARYREQFGTSP
jgi:AraC-like DNA-binding protein